MSAIKYINLSDLEFPEFEAHQEVNEDTLRELSDSIKDIGIIEPLIVRKVNKHFEVVAGCLRFRAAVIGGLKAAPCIILSINDEQAEIIKLHENIKRVNLDHIDQGNTFIMMRKKFDMTEEQIAARVGKSISYVSNHISLVTQDTELTAAVKSNSISFSQARELLQIKDISTRKQLMNYCQDDGATITVLRQWIKEYKDQQQLNPDKGNKSHVGHISYSNPDFLRKCAACLEPIEPAHIRQVFYCTLCHTAIMEALKTERASNTE